MTGHGNYRDIRLSNFMSQGDVSNGVLPGIHLDDGNASVLVS